MEVEQVFRTVGIYLARQVSLSWTPQVPKVHSIQFVLESNQYNLSFFPGGLQAGSTTNSATGANLIIITYDLVVDPKVMESGNITSSNARITGYSSRSNGTNYVSALLLQNDPELESGPYVQVLRPSFTFKLNSSDIAEPQPQILAVGETATFQLNATFPVGQTDKTVLNITMPSANGFPLIQIFSFQVVSVGSNLNVAAFAGTLGVGGNGISWQVGKVQKLSQGSYSQSSIVVEATGTVTNNPDNVNGVQEHAVGDMDYEMKGNLTTAIPVVVDIVEPHLQIVGSSSPSFGIFGGEEIIYNLEISHQSDSRSPAFNISVIDQLPSVLVLNTSSVTSNNAKTSFSSSATVVNARLASLPLGQTLSLSYRATVGYPSFFIGNPVITTPLLTYLSAPTGSNARTYQSSNNVTVLAQQPVVITSIESTSLASTSNPFVAIGEEIVYWINVTLPRGSTRLNVTLLLPQSYTSGFLECISSSVISVGGISGSPLQLGQAGTVSNSSNGLLVSWNFGQISNNRENGTVVLEVVGRVSDSPQNTAGKGINAVATASFAEENSTQSPTLQLFSDSPTEYVDGSGLGGIVKSANTSKIQGGDVITFHVVAKYGYGSYPGPVYNLTISDQLSQNLQLISGTVALQNLSRSNNTQIIRGNSPGDTTILVSVKEPSGLPTSSGTFGITYLAKVSSSAPTSTNITNNASLMWYSAPDTSVARSYWQTVSATVQTLSPVISLSITGSSIHQKAFNDLSIGETVNLSSKIVLPLCSTSLIANISLLGQSGHGILGWLQGTEAVHIDPSVLSANSNRPATWQLLLVDTNSDGFLDTGSFNFGSISTTGPNSTISISISGIVENVTANANLVTAAPQLRVLSVNNLQLASTSLSIVEPQLSISITANTTSIQAGDHVQFTIKASHTSQSDAPAFNLSIAEQLLSELQLLTSSIVVSPSGSATILDSNSEIKVGVPSLALSSSIQIGSQSSQHL